MNEATATAAKTTRRKAPWMDLTSIEEVNEYLRGVKTGGTRAQSIRAAWQEAHGEKPAAPNGKAEPLVLGSAMVDGYEHLETEHVTEGPQGDMGDLIDAEEERSAPSSPAPEHPTAPVETKPTAIDDEVRLDAELAKADAPRAKRPEALRTRFIDPEMVDVREGWNARIDFGDLEELARSILAQKALDGHGLLNDIRVKEKADGRYELIDGERRWQSVMGLIDRGHEWEFGIPAKVEPADSTDADLIIKMFAANQSKPFLPYEEALYYKRLQDEGWTLAQIEEKTGRSDNSIVGALALLQADEDLQDAVIKGTLGATMAKSIAVNVRGNKARQKELVAKAKDAKKTGDKAKLAEVKKAVDDERRAKAAKKAPNLKLKARKADEAEIAQVGSDVGARLAKLMADLGLPHETDMREWIAADRELRIAATFGALTALKRVMGVHEKVEF